MKISAISTKSFLKQPHFAGFYKKNSRIEFQDKKVFSDDEVFPAKQIEVNRIYYYPFANETKEEIEDFVNDNTDNKVEYPSSDSSKQIIKQTETSVSVEKPLSFNEKDYEDYLKSIGKAKDMYEDDQAFIRREAIKQYIPTDAIEIENELRQSGLDRYIISY